MNGKAYIIGTGPGDEELLTVKAVKVLEKCTAVLYDRLVSNNILNYLNEDCLVYYCGKEPGAHYKTQEEINNMLVKLVKEGHIVGRVKGGDPYVFGRGGEEVLSLVEENLDFEVIPGVTSPISVLNYAGIPITQRAIAQSFHIVTGMTSASEKINWEALAKENGTLVFMMGLENIERIVTNLITNGKEKSTPAAVVMRGTSSKQRKVIGTLENISEKVREAGLKSPCIIVVGEVVELNDKLSWYEKKPLFGTNICITRSREQSSSLKSSLKDLGAEVTEINSIKIRPTKENLKPYLEKLSNYDHILLTSVNGVNNFFDYLIEENYDIGEGLFKVLAPHLVKGEKVLIPCSSSSRSYLVDEISKLGLYVDRVHTYDTICGTLKNKRVFDEVDYVLFTSPSTVINMIDMLGLEAIKEKKLIAIGPQTAKAIKERNMECFICKKHSEEGFLKEIIEFKEAENV